MEQPYYTSRRVHKITDTEEKKLVILKATKSIENKFGSNTILDDEERQLNMFRRFLLAFCR